MFQNEFPLSNEFSFPNKLYSHCRTVVPCLKYILNFFCILDENYPLKCFFGSTGHVALDRNTGLGYLRQFHTLSGLLDRRAAQSNFYPNKCVPMQEAFLPIL